MIAGREGEGAPRSDGFCCSSTLDLSLARALRVVGAANEAIIRPSSPWISSDQPTLMSAMRESGITAFRVMLVTSTASAVTLRAGRKYAAIPIIAKAAPKPSPCCVLPWPEDITPPAPRTIPRPTQSQPQTSELRAR